MIVSAAIVSKDGNLFYSDFLPFELKSDLSKHVKNFLYTISVEDDDIELPYFETTDLRYIYKQTDDLYWILVTKLDSDMFTDIDLMGKFVCSIMEYGSAETNSSTLTEQQRDLFYRHIWRPWDDGLRCSFCNCNCVSSERWEQEFSSRLQFLTSIKNGDVDDSDAKYFSGLIDECWALIAQVSPKWDSHKKSFDPSETDSFCSSDSQDSVSEEEVIDGCRIKCRLEDMRIELARIQDPYLRLFARRDLLDDSPYNLNTSQLKSAPSYKDMDTSDITSCCQAEFTPSEKMSW